MRFSNGKFVFGVESLKLPNFVRSETGVAECKDNPKHKKFTGVYAVYDDGSRELVTGCPECQAEQVVQEMELLKQEKIQHYKDCHIMPEYWGKTLSDYVCESESQKNAAEAAKAMIGGKLQKIVLLGEHGTGKTMLASIIADILNGKIFRMNEISAMIRKSFVEKTEQSEMDILNDLGTIPFLAIDEMGRTNGSSAEKNWLSAIVDSRHTRGLPLVLIGNGHLRGSCPNNGCPMCFENYISSDIVSRMCQNSRIINMKGKDFRMVR